jgi:hypothetical protein
MLTLLSLFRGHSGTQKNVQLEQKYRCFVGLILVVLRRTFNWNENMSWDIPDFSIFSKGQLVPIPRQTKFCSSTRHQAPGNRHQAPFFPTQNIFDKFPRMLGSTVEWARSYNNYRYLPTTCLPFCNYYYRTNLLFHHEAVEH